MRFSLTVVFALASYLAAADFTDFIVYSGLGFSGSYKQITSMDENSGTCSSQDKSFSGSLSPLDEDLSVHIRGPINLKKFAVYTVSSGNSKRDVPCDEQVNLKRHLHHQHKRDVYVATTDVTVTVTEGDSPATSAAAASSSPAALSIGAVNKVIDAYHSTDSAPSVSSASATASAGPVASGDWSRVSNYDASSGSADNVVFMNHKGDPSLSGTFSYKFGNSLSYSDASGIKPAKSATVLSDTTLVSDQEVVLFSNSDCDDSCGFSRSGAPAKKGWAGTTKIFVFNFKMPTDNSGSNNVNMPAIWLLNGQIPRTLQYGAESCSCWSTGCGEFDLWEITDKGSSNLETHIHDGQGQPGTRYGGGGSGSFFQRPSDYETFAAIFTGSDVYLKKLDNFNFDSSISADTVKGWVSGSPTKANLVA